MLSRLWASPPPSNKGLAAPKAEGVDRVAVLVRDHVRRMIGLRLPDVLIGRLHSGAWGRRLDGVVHPLWSNPSSGRPHGRQIRRSAPCHRLAGPSLRTPRSARRRRQRTPMAHFGSFQDASTSGVPPAAFTASRTFFRLLLPQSLEISLMASWTASGGPMLARLSGSLRPVGVLIDETSLAHACVNPRAFPEVPRAHNVRRRPGLWLRLLGKTKSLAPPSELRMSTASTVIAAEIQGKLKRLALAPMRYRTPSATCVGARDP